jgi:hypothetical protein
MIVPVVNRINMHESTKALKSLDTDFKRVLCEEFVFLIEGFKINTQNKLPPTHAVAEIR